MAVDKNEVGINGGAAQEAVEEDENMREFEKLLKEYLETNENRLDDAWNNKGKCAALKADLDGWKDYHDLIKDKGLPLTVDKKNPPDPNKKELSWARSYVKHKEYLPNFLLTQTKMMCGISAGTSEQFMIYYHIDEDKKNTKKSNAFYSGYTTKDYIKSDGGVPQVINDDYKTYIMPLLKRIVEVKNPEGVYTLENDDIYTKFRSKQIKRKMILLESMIRNYTDPLYNQFLWVCADNKLDEIAKRFDIDITDKDNFFTNNKIVYDKLKKSYVNVKTELNSSVKGENDKPLSVDNMTKQHIFELYMFVLDVFFEKRNELFTSFTDINVIFNGAPGTGKTYTVSKDIKNLHTKVNKELYNMPSTIQFHPSYTYQDFIEGIKPMGIDDKGNLKLQVVNGSFKDFCIKVRKENEKHWIDENLDDGNNKDKRPNKDKPETLEGWPHYYFVVDEINRGNLSNIFGETFTLLEYRDYDFSGDYHENADDENDNSSATLAETTYANVIKQLVKDKNNAGNNKTEVALAKLAELKKDIEKIEGQSVDSIKKDIEKLKKHVTGDVDLQKKIDELSSELERRLKAVNYPDLGDIKNQLEEIEKAITDINTDSEQFDVDSLYYKKVKKGDDFDIKFGIPFNIHFIGMMNDVDRSIDSFDLAFRRRFRWEPMYCDYKAIYETLYIISENETWRDSVADYVKSCAKLNYYITNYINKSDLPEEIFNEDDTITVLTKINNFGGYGRVYEIGQGYFLKIKYIVKQISNGITKEHKKVLFDNYIMGTIKEYIRQMADDENTIKDRLDDARKVFIGDVT